MSEEWKVYNLKADYTAIGNSLGISPYLAKILCNRKLRTYDEMMDYLHPERMQLHSPMLLSDVEKASQLICEALNAGKHIRIVGDYDVDGVTSIAVLYRALKPLAKGILDWQVPHRILDGYGLNQNIIEQAKLDQVDMIITCDNGIAAGYEISLAKAYGMCVVVTDHHEVPGEGNSILIADAVVNPKHPDSKYPYKDICGAVVAWKLLCVVYDRLEGHSAEELDYLTELIALATVADVMDLKSENRAIVKKGLEQIATTKNLGLEKLLEALGISAGSVSSGTIGFQIGPALNAGGRLETAQKAVNLLITEDQTQAATLATELVSLNSRRKELTEKAVEDAKTLVETTELCEDRVLVIYLPDCHESVAGIVAGRIREQFYRPTFIITNATEGLKGSGRSISGYDMFHEMEKVRECFTKFGGHEMAAGLSLTKDDLEPFRKKINEVCTLSEKELTETVWIDLDLVPHFASLSFARELHFLEPFGKGNETPLFATRNLVLRRLSIVGKERKGLKISFEDADHFRGEMTYWGDITKFQEDFVAFYDQDIWESMFLQAKQEVKMLVIYTIGINSYRGEEYVRLMMKKYRFQG